MNSWLLLDSNYLCHRAFHALSNLTFNEEPTAVFYGFLCDVLRLQEEFRTKRIVFAFDAGHGKRLGVYPQYKQSRQDVSEEDKQARLDLQKQIRKLRDKYLWQLGYRNVFWQDGYEADDIIASVIRGSLNSDHAIIVSADQDLWQLIDQHVSCYNPRSKKLMDYTAFTKQWSIEPPLWAHVKAIAGCTSDNVRGVKGIGEIYAAKWYAGTLKPGSAAFKKIQEGMHIHNRNIKVTRLPFPGCNNFDLKEDKVNTEKWHAVSEELGAPSLMELVPGMPKAVKKTSRRPVGFGFK